ncbi:MAG: hypothetical protein QM817_23195 [Archangium sp.]
MHFALAIALVLSGGPQFATVKANCKPVQVREFEIKVCLRGKPPSSYVATFTTDGGTPITLEERFEPSGTFDGVIRVFESNERYFAYTSDDFECTIAFVVDRTTGKVVAESGCGNSKYCSVVKLPKPDECKVTFSCGEGEDPSGYERTTKSWCSKKK